MAVYLIEIVMIVALSPLARCRISVIKNRKEFKGNDVYLFLVFFMLGLVMALRAKSVGTDTFTYYIINQTTLIISKKPGNTGISRDIRTEFTTDLLLSD